MGRETGTADGVRRVRVGDGEIELAYETFGDESAEPLLLIMGLATQMLGWPQPFCEALAARGYLVIRYDNRDVGLSTHLDAPAADLQGVAGGDRSTAPYRIDDLARDAAGLLDALGIDRAHVVGASMGGMIAQALTIAHPDRVRSLTSIMSTTGELSVGYPTQAAVEVLMAPPAGSREEALDRAVATYRVIGSPAFEMDEAAIRERAGLSYDRAYDPAGTSRQLAAILTSPDRTPGLRELAVPTLVIHGREDQLVQLSGGEATAAAIPGAELAVIDGMGHDLPEPLWEEIVERIARHAGGVAA